ncbi:DUF3343 domain-containing protein [Miniphocaeibacter halophilus]|uniref:DUF3343 domain-containing protein n=1 Tax=Miniphocaeibacter halophilus TaxID=2931922 RepID=A0AC61MS75_9FIRM|nr:DUF3343 domain-containing protein [Miniphocaeibacter halophilus]QQK08297.1 DUF3343 domain-containing protein [Miniphocaeibacter halophilus]
MSNRKYYVFMPKAADAMALLQNIKEKGVESTLVPTPREADHCCGVSILYYNPLDKEKIEFIALEEEIPIDGFWDMENKDDPNRNRFL